MNMLSSFLSVNRPCDEASDWLNRSLSRNGFRVLQTFDLHNARLGLHGCTCPHHGTDQCDCQMVVLLIYERMENPVTLVLHGNDDQTWISLVNDSIQPADRSLQSSIVQALLQSHAA